MAWVSFQRAAWAVLWAAVCFRAAVVCSATPLAVSPDGGSVVLTSGGQSLTVSLACPRFVFEGAAVDAAPSVTADRAWDGAKPLEIAVTPLALGEDAKLEVRVCAAWSPTENVLRKWARFRVSGAASPVLLREVVLATLDEPGRWCWDLAAPAGTPSTKPATLAGDRQSQPLFYDGFFAGIEFPVADTRHEGSRAVFAYRPGLRVAAGQWLETHKAVFGIAPRGRELAAFHRYITAHRPPPSGFHLNYNSWWTSPVPYAEADILKLIATFEKALYRPHGVSFDTFCIDLGWSNPRSLWEIDGTMFPAGFAGLKDATARMGSHTGVWISPSGCYSGIAGSLDNEWAAAQGYESFTLGPPPEIGRAHV